MNKLLYSSGVTEKKTIVFPNSLSSSAPLVSEFDSSGASETGGKNYKSYN